MRLDRISRLAAVMTVALGLFVLGLSLAAAGKPEAHGPRKSSARTGKAKPRGVIDCKLLERRMSACAPAIAAAFDPGLGGRLARYAPLLRGALLRTISQEFVARVAGPCFSTKGRLDDGKALQLCLAAARPKPCKARDSGCERRSRIAACRKLATCLAAKIRALPRRKATGARH